MDTEVKEVSAGWNDAVVMVCDSCGKEALRIKAELKNKIKEETSKSVRVITTSCLNICPENKIAITVVNKTNHAFNAFSIGQDINATELYNQIKDKL